MTLGSLVIPVRPDDPPSARLTALLVAALGAFALLLGGWSSSTAPIMGAVAADTVHEDVAPGDAVTERRDVRAERRTRAGGRRQPFVRRSLFLRRTAFVLTRTALVWRAGPLRGPPRTATA